MNTLEFSTKIHHGTIKLPTQYEKDYNEMEAKVILLFEQKEAGVSQKDKLRAIFSTMKGLDMFSSIENPTEWQKQQRDDWE